MRSWHSLLHAPCPDLDDDVLLSLRWSCWLGSGDHHGDHHRDRAVRVSVVVMGGRDGYVLLHARAGDGAGGADIMALIATVMMMKAARANYGAT